jgi:hypothetical protein
MCFVAAVPVRHSAAPPALPPQRATRVAVVDQSTTLHRPVLEDGLSPAVSPSELDGGSDNDPDDVIDDSCGSGTVFQRIYSRPRNLHIGRHASVPSSAGSGASLSSSAATARGETPSKRRSSTGSPGGSSTGSDSSDHVTPSSTSSTSSTSSGIGGVQMRHHQHSHHADMAERRRSVPPSSADRSSSSSSIYHQHDGVTSSTGGQTSAERNQSPSRRSPKSPPRSPSAWMQRMRESPTRATQPGGGGVTSSGVMIGGGRCPTGAGMRSPTQLSPGSAVERYPSNELHDAPAGMPSSADDDDAASGSHGSVADGYDIASAVNGGIQRCVGGVSAGSNGLTSDEQRIGGGSATAGGLLDLSESAAVDLASFAASVASGAAHLTQLSDSPSDLLLKLAAPSINDNAAFASSDARQHQPMVSHVSISQPPPHQLLSGTVTISSSTGPSFVAADFLSPDEYVGVGSFDVRQHHHHHFQQSGSSTAGDMSGLVLPPPPPPCPPAGDEDDDGGQATSSSAVAAAGCCGDWSLRVDLSPIIDVSPSIERIEQENMLADQRQLQSSASGKSPTTTVVTVDSDENRLQADIYEATRSCYGASVLGTGSIDMIDSRGASSAAAETSPTMFGLMKRCSSFSDIPTLTSQDDPQQPTPASASTVAAAGADPASDVFRFEGSSAATNFEVQSLVGTSLNGKQQTCQEQQDRQLQQQTQKREADDDDELVGGLQKFDDWFKAAFQELIAQDSKDSSTEQQQSQRTATATTQLSTSDVEAAETADKSSIIGSTMSSSKAKHSRALSGDASSSSRFPHQRDDHEDEEDDDLIHQGHFVGLAHDDNDDEHEIDLDEDIPPKHVFVATSKFRRQRTLEKQDAVDDNCGHQMTQGESEQQHRQHEKTSDDFDIGRTTTGLHKANAFLFLVINYVTYVFKFKLAASLNLMSL